MKNNRIGSTIILGIFLLICLFLISRLLPLSLAEELSAYREQAGQGSEETVEMGEMIIVYSLVLGIGALAIVIAAHLWALAPLIIAAVCLPFAIKNCRVDFKAQKVINILYAVAFSAVIITATVKIILFWI